MKELKVKIKRLTENAVIPAYAHATDVGMDLVALPAGQNSRLFFIC